MAPAASPHVICTSDVVPPTLIAMKDGRPGAGGIVGTGNVIVAMEVEVSVPEVATTVHIPATAPAVYVLPDIVPPVA